MADTREQCTSSRIAANLASHCGHAGNDLDRDGLVRLRGVISSDWLAAARGDVDTFLARHGRGEHSLVGNPDRWECPNIAELAVDKDVESFLQSLTSAPRDAAAGYGGYQQRVLRILDGSGVDSLPFDWHYDSNAVTMLVPIVIPDDGSGLVAMFPDHRPHRRSSTVGAVERLFVHNKTYGRRMRRRYESDPAAFTVPLNPGDAYIFRGYRALHATLPWPRDTLRVTLVLQYGRPYGSERPVVQRVRARRDSLKKRRTVT